MKGKAKMNFNDLEIEDLIDIYKKIEDFLKFLDKEHKKDEK